jgi:hypothetical protein
VDIFSSYDDAVTWLKSIGGYVGPVERRDTLNSVSVFGSNGLAITSTFDTGYREAVRLACSELCQAMGGGSEMGVAEGPE